MHYAMDCVMHYAMHCVMHYVMHNVMHCGKYYYYYYHCTEVRCSESSLASQCTT